MRLCSQRHRPQNHSITLKPKGSFKKPRDYEDGDDDEEIFSDSDAYADYSEPEIAEEPKAKKTKKEQETSRK